MDVRAMKPAVVLVSGGMDSAVVLAIAQEQGYACHALSVRYGQRHTSELDAADRIARALDAVAHKTVEVDLRSIGGSALTDADIEVPLDSNEDPASPAIPVTYVPGAQHDHAVARARLGRSAGRGGHLLRRQRRRLLGLSRLPAGIHRRVRALANLATKAGVEGAGFRVHAPLMHMSKADIVREGLRLSVDFAQTVSCYQADHDGRACGHCDACRLRAEGFAAAGVRRSHPLRR